MTESTPRLRTVLARTGAVLFAISAMTYLVVLAQCNANRPRDPAPVTTPSRVPAAEEVEKKPAKKEPDVLELPFLATSKSSIITPLPKSATAAKAKPADGTPVKFDDTKPNPFLFSSKSAVLPSDTFNLPISDAQMKKAVKQLDSEEKKRVFLPSSKMLAIDPIPAVPNKKAPPTPPGAKGK